MIVTYDKGGIWNLSFVLRASLRATPRGELFGRVAESGDGYASFAYRRRVKAFIGEPSSMKKFLWIMALVCASAQADDYLVTPTKAGGEIILTTQKPEACNGLFFMYAVGPNQEVFYGCWTSLNGMVHVRYDDGTRRVYDHKGWVLRRGEKNE